MDQFSGGTPDCFLRTHMDVLVLGRHTLEREAVALAAPVAGAHDDGHGSDHGGPGDPSGRARLRPLHVDPATRAIVDDRDRRKFAERWTRDGLAPRRAQGQG